MRVRMSSFTPRAVTEPGLVTALVEVCGDPPSGPRSIDKGNRSTERSCVGDFTDNK